MKLTENMQKALKVLSRTEWRSAYDVQMSRGTLEALTERKLAEGRYGLGSIAFARTHIKYRLTEAGEAAAKGEAQ